MNLKKILCAAAMASCVPMTVTAGEVASGDVPTFEAGQPARAADVNQAFQTLVDAINDNAQAIAGLRSDVTALTVPDVSGKAYYLNRLLVGLAVEQQSRFSNILTSATEYYVEFDPSDGNSGTGSVVGSGESEYEVNLPSNTLSTFSDEPFVQDFTWEQFGGFVEITFPPEEPGAESDSILFNVSPGGQILTGYANNREPTDFDDGSLGEHAESELFIAVETEPDLSAGTAP